MRGAALLQFGSKYISMGAQIVITAVLARLIAPEDFGLVAIVTVFTGFFCFYLTWELELQLSSIAT